MGRVGRRPAVRSALAATAALVLAGPALSEGAIAPELHDPANCEVLSAAPGSDAVRCDDGVPSAGGTTPNEGGAAAITVPARYRGYRGLPRRAEGAGDVPGADSRGDVALDVDVTLPKRAAGPRGFPLVVLMHGCCAGSKESWQADTADAPGERWHYNDAWFASRGYAVITYTARGFVDKDEHGSTGETELDSRAYEINDYQHLACQVATAARRGAFDDAVERRVRIDPRRVVATGGSYGGGFSWMALTDPRWRCPGQDGSGRRAMRLAAVAPKYGWTDLVYSLVPTGLHRSNPGRLPDIRGCDSGPVTLSGEDCASGAPVGIPKRSIVAGLYASGKTGVPPGTSSHTTFPPKIDEAIACLELPYPPAASNPACTSTLTELLPEFLRERSAYYQNRFFRRAARRPGWRIPVFNAATFTDPLFPPIENLRMENRLRALAPGYPIQIYHGDYQHFTQNKAKEWGDVCDSGGARHVCTTDDFEGDFDRRPPSRVRLGATTMLNRFIDHYARPSANRRERRPRFNVTASLQICPENAGSRPTDEPGPRFRARTFGALTPDTLRIAIDGEQVTTSTALPNTHALVADPVANQASNGARCAVHSEPAGLGVATYTSDPLEEPATVLGPTRVRADFDVTSPTDSGVQLNVRLYDVLPNGDAVLVDRGPRILTPAEIAAGKATVETHANGWRFEAGHRVRVELAQDDDPYLHRTDASVSSIALHGVRLSLPTR